MKNDDRTEKTKYTDIKKYFQDNGYIQEQICLDETNEIVSRNSLAKGSTGTVVNIRCPARYKIAIIGRNQLSEDDLNMAHSIRVRFADSDNNEIAPDTRIRIKKAKPSEMIMVIANVLYKDITITNYQKESPNKIKSDTNWYRLNDGVLINGAEHLEFDVVNPDRNIDAKNVKLAIDADFWEGE